MHRMKRITSMLDIEADRVDNAVGTHNGGLYGALVVCIGGDLFEAVENDRLTTMPKLSTGNGVASTFGSD